MTGMMKSRKFEAGGSSEALRVAHLDHSRESGGAELSLVRILANASTWSPTLVLPRSTASGTGVFASLSSVSTVEIVEVGPAQTPGASAQRIGVIASASFALALIKQALAVRFSPAFREAHVLHANTSRSGVYGALVCLTSSKPFVVHLRDMVTPESLGGIGFQLFTKLALPRANGVISNSRGTLESASRFIRKSATTTVIPSAIGVSERVAFEKQPTDVRLIGMVARIDTWKGHSLLLRAFAVACESVDVRLVLAGGASFGKEAELESLKRLARELGIDRRVDFLGHVDDVQAQIERMDICVQASTRPEPLGQNVLQYLAAGKPVIAVNAGGPAEWIVNGTNGILVPIDDVDALARALNDLIHDHSLRVKLAANARNTPGIESDSQIASRHGDFFNGIAKRTIDGSRMPPA